MATAIELVLGTDLELRQQRQGGGLVTGRAWDEAPNMWRVETLKAPDWLHPQVANHYARGKSRRDHVSIFSKKSMSKV